VPPVKPGIPPPRVKAIIDVNVGMAGGRVTVAVTVGKAGATRGVKGNGKIKAVGRNVPAVRLTITESVGVGGGASAGTRPVMVNPAAVSCGTVTVKGVKLAKGIAALLNGDITGNVGNACRGEKLGMPGIPKKGNTCAFACGINTIDKHIIIPKNINLLFVNFSLMFFIL
jgi:hypothetical protein